MANNQCGICDSTLNTSQGKLLYGQPVCSKCYHAFAIRRQIGFLIDVIIFGIIYIFILIFIELIGFLIFGNNALELMSSSGEKLFGLLVFLVFCMKDGINGYSLGKYAMGVRVIDRVSRKPSGIMASLKRNFSLIITCIPIIILFTIYKGARIGDKSANTYVIWNKYKDKLPFTAPSFVISDKLPWQ